MVKILREADKSPVSEVAKKHGVSDVTIYAWRKRFGQLEAVDVKRLRALEAENARLRRC
jgi:putative transposase